MSPTGNGVSVSNTNASSAKNIEWKTWTSTLGFGVQGIWPGVDFTDVNSVCRSQDGTILATGDDFGKVKLFKWPCIEEKADYNESIGHSSHVTEVKFSYQDQFVVSAGGNDKTVMVWEVEGRANQPQADAEVDYASDPDDPDKVDTTDYSKLAK